MWTEIITEEDINKLKELYGNFHDSCLRDIYISTSDFVDEKRAMHFDSELTASLLFQRQLKNDPVLELKFIGVKRMSFQPMPKNYNGLIYDATLKIKDGLFYWADFEGWDITEDESDDTESIWVCGERLFWRLRPELIGNIKRLSDQF